jgi:hypothetical protein
MRRVPAIACAILVPACIEPRVSDEPGLPGLILPPGSTVPSAHDDPVIERQIDMNDGVGDEVLRVNGFASGESVTYWDLGPAPDFAAPIFVLFRAGEAGELEPIDHPPIIDAVPGDVGYSPFWAAFALVVTDDYQDEVLTSFAAVQEAEQLDLVEPPELLDVGFNCPVVASDVTVEVGEGQPPLAAQSQFFWRGMTVHYYDFGRFALEEDADVPVSPRYVIRREGSEPLSEIARGVDITGDGDVNDTNDVFAQRFDEPGFSPLCATVEVAVVVDTPAIDSSGDETMSSIRAATDLFDPDAIPDRVVAFEETEDLRNCPQQRVAGAL